MGRVEARTWYCPICRDQQETTDWTGPVCTTDGCACNGRPMRRMIAGKDGIFVKQ